MALLWASYAGAQSHTEIRIATFAAPLSREGPGLLLRDIEKGDDAQIAAILAVIARINPDVLLLTDIDFDAGGVALAAFSDLLPSPYPFRFALQPNSGRQTGLDLDGDGFTGDARDALGYGRFLGDGGMAVLSKYPVIDEDVRNLTDYLWKDVPGAVLPAQAGALFPSAEVFDTLPVSSTGHWIVPIDVDGQRITLLALDATAPIFDGPEDFNGLRNRDELRLWEAVLDGGLGPVPLRPILIGNVNADPFDGEGLRDGIAGFLARPDLLDPQPRSGGGMASADAGHGGDPALDTADWPSDGPGNLRVSYVLPSTDFTVADAGVFWPASVDPLASLLGEDGLAAGPHRLVWIDLRIDR